LLRNASAHSSLFLAMTVKAGYSSVHWKEQGW
jgi:hypothetical protein